MLLLNIFQHYDGTTAWDNIAILILALVGGYLLNRTLVKTKENSKFNAAVRQWENKHKLLENEFKAYRSNIASSEKISLKSATELSGRVKALEGDIRALSEEKNKFHQQLLSKQEDLKKNSTRIAELEDKLKIQQEDKFRSEADWNQKLKTAREELAKAAIWETKVRAAEEEMQKARFANSQAERKKLEAELRLKSTIEYAGKVGPLENELSTAKEKYAKLEEQATGKSSLLSQAEEKLGLAEIGLKKDLVEIQDLKNDLLAKSKMLEVQEQKMQSAEQAVSTQRITEAELELLKTKNAVLQQEVEARHTANIALVSEIEQAKTNLRKLVEEIEKLKSIKPGPIGVPSLKKEVSKVGETTNLEGIGPDGGVL
jgi:chromosome segregation ATPase